MIGVCSSGNTSLWSSLQTIRQAQAQLCELDDAGATCAIISNRIQLCEVLLGEIYGIRASLARHMAHTRDEAPEDSQLHS
jgi:hypothetical protein